MQTSPTNKKPGRIKEQLRNVFFIAGSIVILSLLMELLNSSDNIAPDNNTFNQNYKIFPAPLPYSISFAGEKVPMNHFGVRESLEQEILVNTYWQSQTLLMLKRIHRYFPVIEPILKKNGIPDDFKYVALAESGFNYKVSPVGAAGFWQMMKPTAQAYGLEVDKDIDERYNLERSTEAACQYFKDAYAQFHNWTLVAASYNLGLAGVEKEMDKQKQNNYYDLILNSETARYVYRILALKELTTNPRQYGFFLKKSDLYDPVPTYTVTADTTIPDLADYALSKGISYRILKLFNPWLLTNKLPDDNGHIYPITMPVKNVPFLDLGEYITFVDSTSVTAKTTDSIMKQESTEKANLIIHIVKPGEDLKSIAKQYNTTVERLCTWNAISDTVKIKPYDELMIFKK